MGVAFQTTGGINITTMIKEAPGCRGSLRRRTCSLEQATVEYPVRLTRDTIALCSDTTFGYQLAERANASANANTSATLARSRTIATIWQPPQDRVVSLTPSYDGVEASIWSRLFSLLYEPMQVNLTAHEHGVDSTSH